MTSALNNGFKGTAKALSPDAVAKAADELGCDIAAVQAVIMVESRGGFLADKRPKILFERHHFCRHTKGAYDRSHPDVSSRKAGGYRGGSSEYARLEAAFALNGEAALRSASWGAFQIMGSNHRMAGYDDVQSFCEAMCESEDKQLDASVKFVKSARLDDELRRRDWAGFARGYNGPSYRINRYDEKLKAAYTIHTSSPAADGARIARTLRMGDHGEDVKQLQQALKVKIDGDFGPATKAAVVKHQKSKQLEDDGIAGPRTLRSLGL